MFRYIRCIFSLLVAFQMIACGGGSSGGSSNGGPPAKPKPVYLEVGWVKPENAAVDVAYDQVVTVRFSEEIDTEAFVNSQAKIGKLLEDHQLAVYQLSTFEKVTGIDLEPLTLETLLSGQYIVMAEEEGAPTIEDAIKSYEVDEENFDAPLVLVSVSGKRFPFSHQSLKDTDLFEQDMVQLLDSEGNKVKVRLISNEYSWVELHPYEYLKYGESYQVRVSKNLVSKKNHSLKEEFLSSFKVKELPSPEYTSYSPANVDSHPLNSVEISVNFDLDANIDLDSAIQVVEILKGEDGEIYEIPVVTQKKIGTYSTRTIFVSKNNYWGYQKQYKVKVDGSYLTGTNGPSGALSLKDKNLEWEFTTSSPKVVSITPSGSNANSESVTRSIYIDLNFPVSTEQLKDFVDIQTSEGYFYDFEVTETSQGKYTLKPKTSLLYFTAHKVVVHAGLTSRDDATVFLKENKEASFHTEAKAILSLNPYSGQKAVSRADRKVQIDFNFPLDVDPRLYIHLEENSDGKRDNLEFSFTYSNGRKSISLDPRLDGAARTFDFNSIITVRIDSGIAGANLAGFNDYEYKFTVENSLLQIASSVPYNGKTLSPVKDDAVSVSFNKTLATENLPERPIWIKYDCSGYSGVLNEGSYKLVGKTIYFDPKDSKLPDDGKYLASGCRHLIEVDSSLRGELGERFEASSSTQVRFDTDYLDVDKIRLEYAYSDRVAIDSIIEVEFSHYLDWYFSDSNFGLKEGVYERSVSVSSSGDDARVDPYSNMKYGKSYRMWVYSTLDKKTGIYNPIRANSGEKLVSSYYVDFQTENMPLELTGVSPTGSNVSVASNIYADMNFSEYEDGFPKYVDAEIRATYYNELNARTETYNYTASDYRLDLSWKDLDIIFDEDLFYDATYDVEITFTFEDGETLEYEWEFSTEKDTSWPSSSAKKKSSLLKRKRTPDQMAVSKVNKQSQSFAKTSKLKGFQQRGQERSKERALSSKQVQRVEDKVRDLEVLEKKQNRLEVPKMLRRANTLVR